MTHIRHSEYCRSLRPVGRCSVNTRKIAVCFFGITRNFSKYTLNSIEQNVFKQIAYHDTRFRKLAHFNILFPVSNQTYEHPGVAIDPEEFKVLNCDVARHTYLDELDQKIDFTYVKQFGDIWNIELGPLADHLRSLYSLNAVTELLLREKTRFDLVIFLRADLRFNRPLQIPKILPHTLYTPWFDRYSGLNDRFAMGDFETMILYGQRQKSILAECENNRWTLSPNHNLLRYARKQGLKVRHLRAIDFSQIRSNGVVSAIDCFRESKLEYYFRSGLEALKLRRF